MASNALPPLPRRILLLGSDGFIGSHLLEALLGEESIEVTGWDRELARTAHRLGHPRFRFRSSDIQSDPDLLRRDIADADVVVNLAALCNPSLYGSKTIDVIESNFLHAEPVVRACAETGTRLVHFSTSEVFGRTLESWSPSFGAPPREDLPLDEEETPFLLGPLHRTRWSYACAKQLLERLIEAYGREKGLHWTLVRPFNFIGPRMDYLPGIDGEGTPRVLACFMESLLHRRPLKLVDGGISRRTFLHVSEAIDGLLEILRRPADADRRIFHLGHPGNETDIRGLATAMRRIWSELRHDPSILAIPLTDIPSSEFYGEGYEDSDRRIPSIRNARTLLGWTPRIGLESALRMTLSDYHQRFPEDPK